MTDLFTVEDRVAIANEYLRHYQEKRYRIELELKVVNSLDPAGEDPAANALQEQIAWYDISIKTVEAELDILTAQD